MIHWNQHKKGGFPVKEKLLIVFAVTVLCAGCSFSKESPPEPPPQPQNQRMSDKEIFEKAHAETKARIEEIYREYDERQKANAGK